MVKLRCCCIVVLLLASGVESAAGDSLKVVSFNSPKWCKLENMWLNTGNASGLVFNVRNDVSTVDAGYSRQEGDYHQVMSPSEVNRYSFQASSYQTVTSRFFVGGSFSYNYLDENGARWTGTYEPYRGNPYLLADSLTGVQTHKEEYNIGGQAAWYLTDRFILGGGIRYRVSVAAKQKDPRPEITVTFLEIHPSLLLLGDHHKLGVDFGYSNRKEEISYTTFRTNFTPVFFTFKGFGFYTKEIDYGFYRFQTAHDGYAGLQFERSFSGLSSLSELRASYGYEKIEDGSSVIIREDGGDWKTWQIDFREQIKKRSGNKIHAFSGNLSFLNGDGVEYTQNVVHTGNYEEYVTISKNLKFNRLQLNAGLDYNFLLMKGECRMDWDLQGGLHLLNNQEKYYYVPEVFTSSWLNLTGNVMVKKNFYAGNFHFAPSLDVRYRTNLSGTLFLSDLPEITIKQRPEIYRSDYGYHTAPLLGLHGQLQAGYTPSSGKIGQVNLGFMADWVKTTGEAFTTYCMTMGLAF